MALFRKPERPGDGPEEGAVEHVRGGGVELADRPSGADPLGESLATAGRQMADYLVQRLSEAAPDPSPAALEEKIAHLTAKVEEMVRSAPAGRSLPVASADPLPDKLLAPLQEKLDEISQTLRLIVQAAGNSDAGGSGSGKADDGSAKELLAAVSQQRADFADGLRRLQENVASDLNQLAEQLTARDEEEAAPPEDTSPQWEEAVFGEQLMANTALDGHRRMLIERVRIGDPGACSLAGQLLIYRSAPPERLPQLLKDLGEAYYRWHPKTSPSTDVFEEALVEWVRKHNDAAGVPNTVELVHPGQRFDSGRHTATSRGGVEITEVHGWIVLRDNGKVFFKASVTAR